MRRLRRRHTRTGNDGGSRRERRARRGAERRPHHGGRRNEGRCAESESAARKRHRSGGALLFLERRSGDGQPQGRHYGPKSRHHHDFDLRERHRNLFRGDGRRSDPDRHRVDRILRPGHECLRRSRLQPAGLGRAVRPERRRGLLILRSGNRIGERRNGPHDLPPNRQRHHHGRRQKPPRGQGVDRGHGHRVLRRLGPQQMVDELLARLESRQRHRKQRDGRHRRCRWTVRAETAFPPTT